FDPRERSSVLPVRSRSERTSLPSPETPSGAGEASLVPPTSPIACTRKTIPWAGRSTPPATGEPMQRAVTLFVPCPPTSSLLYQRRARKNSLEKQKASVQHRCINPHG